MIRGKAKLLLVLLIVALVGVLAAGCGGNNAAVVNGKAIPQSEVDKQIDSIKKQQPQAFAGDKGKKLEKNFRERILDQLITAELVKQEAEKQGIKVSDKEIKAKMDQVKKIFNNDDKKFAAALKKQGMTVDEYRSRVHDQLISQKMVDKVIKGLSVSDKEIKDYYKKNKDKFKDPEQFKISLISVDKEETAKKILAEINDGADFAAKAKANSTDPSKDNGGDLGYRRLDEFPPPDAEALKKIKVGEVTEVVNSGGVYHVYKLSDKKPAKQKSFDEVKDQIKQRLLLDKQRAKFLAWIDKLKKEAKISKSAG